MWSQIDPAEVAAGVAAHLRGLGYSLTDADLADMRQQVAEQAHRLSQAEAVAGMIRHSLRPRVGTLARRVDEVVRALPGAAARG